MAWARVASSWMATIQGEMMRRAVCSPYSRSSWISSAWASGKSSRTCSARASGRSSMTAAALSAGIWSSIPGQLGRVEVLDQRRARVASSSSCNTAPASGRLNCLDGVLGRVNGGSGAGSSTGGGSTW